MLLPMLLIAMAGQTAAMPRQPWSHDHGRPFISPMGEPFWPSGSADEPIAQWFRQADRNGDGYLTVDEMEKDAERFFASLDSNHDGQIDPDEVDRYERVIAPQVHGGTVQLRGSQATDDDSDMSDIDPDADASRISGGGTEEGVQGAARYGLLNIPEPVTGADFDLDRSVSLDEFRRAARERFNLLDSNHSGKLTLAQLQGMRPSPSRGGNAHGRGRRHGAWRQLNSSGAG
jgi:Ca2+-binding EF-hand superfamily protein